MRNSADTCTKAWSRVHVVGTSGLSRGALAESSRQIQGTVHQRGGGYCDGTSEKGDIVVGVDGVHSTVREKMWERADRLEPGIIDVKEKKGSVRSMIPTTHRLICDSCDHIVEMPSRVRSR